MFFYIVSQFDMKPFEPKYSCNEIKSRRRHCWRVQTLIAPWIQRSIASVFIWNFSLILIHIFTYKNVFVFLFCVKCTFVCWLNFFFVFLFSIQNTTFITINFRSFLFCFFFLCLDLQNKWCCLFVSFHLS